MHCSESYLRHGVHGKSGERMHLCKPDSSIPRDGRVSWSSPSTQLSLLAVPLRYWQSDNRTSTAVLPHLRATQKGNLARPHSRSPQAVRKPEGPAMHCHLHRGDWSFHLTNEKKKKKTSGSKLLGVTVATSL